MPSRRGRGLRYNRMALAREMFLREGSARPAEVRETILASWRRSRDWNVSPDRIKPVYVRDPDVDTSLARSAVPVLRQLRMHLAGEPIGVTLTDAVGVVLATMTMDDDLRQHLDAVMVAPGFSYAEASVGTNGIGTALESGEPTRIFGHEHYAAPLTDLVSTGVPVYHPISAKLAGAIGLTTWRRSADKLLMPLARTTADQISHALLTDSSGRELDLMQEYLRTCQHTSGIVLAISHDMVMMNDHARHVLDPGDQEMLLARASEVLAQGHSEAVLVELPTGMTARMRCRPTGSARPAGAAGVVQVKLLRPPRSAEEAPILPRMLLPGLVGSAALWLRSCQQVQESYEAGEWLALEGEPGVGKLALARAVHQRRNPTRRFDLLDATEVGARDWPTSIRRALLDADEDLVIRHVDQLGARQAHALAAALQEALAEHGTRHPAARGAAGGKDGKQHRLWVAVTLTHGNAALPRLLRSFPTTVSLPPLRHHIEDLPDLVQFFLGKLSQQGRPTCSPEAMKLLMRSAWPGNVEQLWQVTRRLVQRRRAGSIRPGDLPPECWTVSRRLLGPLEALERDAIVQGLLDADGNKARAADSLGMSRATIYRKMHEYGIIVPASLGMSCQKSLRRDVPQENWLILRASARPKRHRPESGCMRGVELPQSIQRRSQL